MLPRNEKFDDFTERGWSQSGVVSAQAAFSRSQESAKEADTEYATTRIVLRPGDALLFYTDGIAEAFDEQRTQYGATRLQDQLIRCGRSSAEHICAAIQGDVAMHCHSCERADDATLLVIKVSDLR